MCENCRKQHAEDMKQANEHLDAQGVPEDSLARGLVDIQLACNANPMLSILMKHCWQNQAALSQ